MTLKQNDCLQKLAEYSDTTVNNKDFAPVARYYPEMDFVLYLNEDCSYRADRVDTFLTVLWHPLDNRLVGVKIKGFKFIFTQLEKIIDDLNDKDFIPLVKAIEIALVGGYAEALMDQVERERNLRFYTDAIKLVGEVQVEIDDTLKLAA